MVAGGKAHAAPGYLPLPGEPVEIRGEKVTLLTRTDQAGYFILALPAGTYEFRVRGFSRTVRIKAGENSFIALRGGKRMVD